MSFDSLRWNEWWENRFKMSFEEFKDVFQWAINEAVTTWRDLKEAFLEAWENTKRLFWWNTPSLVLVWAGVDDMQTSRQDLAHPSKDNGIVKMKFLQWLKEIFGGSNDELQEQIQKANEVIEELKGTNEKLWLLGQVLQWLKERLEGDEWESWDSDEES